MIKLLKEYRVFLIAYLPLYIVLMLALTVKTNYMIDVPGEINPVNAVIEIDSQNTQKGSFNTTSVWEIKQGTLFQRLFFERIPQAEVYPTPEYVISLSDIDYSKQGSISKDVSITASIINGFKAAGKNITYHYEGKYVYSITKDTKGLKIGDIIVAENGTLAYNILIDYRDGKTTEFEIIRDGKKITVSPESVTGTALYYDYYVIDSSEIEFRINSSNTEGPSGGLLQSLAVYNMLTEFDYTYGYKIAGAGTIDINGNVGAIGAVKEKIYTAHYNKVKIFFVPEDNYDEAYSAYKNLKTDMKLISVSTLNDAISYLEGLK